MNKNTNQRLRSLPYSLLIAFVIIADVLIFPNSSSVAYSKRTVATTSSTDEATSTPFITPFPIDEELISQMNALLSPREDCILPCFWRLEPGKSTVADIKDFIATHPLKKDFDTLEPYEKDGMTIYDLSLRLTENGGLIVQFATLDGKLVYTKVEAHHPINWLLNSPMNLPNMLKALGTPSEVLVKFPLVQFGGIVWTVIYDKHNTIVQYEFDFQKLADDITSNEPIEMCPSLEKTFSIQAWLYSDNLNNAMKEKIGKLKQATPANWPISAMAKTNTEQFAKLFAIDEDHCLKALSKNELEKQKYSFEPPSN
jgi:hypothetical protein